MQKEHQMEHRVTYFEAGGPEHTDTTLDLAFATLSDLGLSYLVVASGGRTVLAAAQRAAATGRTDVKVIGVTLQAGTWAQYGEPDRRLLSEARDLGAEVITCTHSLMGNVESAIRAKFGGMPPVELIAHTLYMFSQGTKVAVEIVLSAVDAGVVPAGTDVVSVAGTGGGADTAYVITSASTVDFFDLRVKRMICKPL